MTHPDETTDSPRSEQAEPANSPTQAEQTGSSYGQDDDGQDYVDRSKIDFDPEDGLYTGTLVTGDSQIPQADDAGESGSDEQPDD